MFFRMTAAMQANHDSLQNEDVGNTHTTKDEKVDVFAAHVSDFAKKAMKKKRLQRNIDPSGRSFPLYQYVCLARMSAKVANSTWFGNFVMLCIVIAGILVGLQTYPSFETDPVMLGMDQAILYVFCLEVVVKIIGEGMQPQLYFIGSNWKWNMFDFLIVFFSLPIVPGMENNVSFLRLIRLLRLAKVFRKVPQLQMIIMGLVGGMKSIIYIVVLLFLVFYLYAFIGIFFFRANDPWHFRSVEISLLTLLGVATLEGWVNVFYINYFGCYKFPGDNYVTDIAERESNKLGATMLCTDPQPQPVLSILFFISFIFICSFSMLSLFVGTVTVSMSEAMDTVREERNAKGMKKKLVEAERKMIAMQLGRSKLDFRLRRRLIILEKAFIGDDISGEIVDDETVSNVFLRYYKLMAFHCQKISVSPWFTNFVTFVIILAGVVVGMSTDKYIVDNFGEGLFALDLIIQIIFTIECVVKIIAEEFTPWKYFDNNWNTFDFIVVVGSYLNVGGSMIILLRLLRLLRVLKLMRALPQLQVIVTALMSGGTSIMFISVLLFLFYYFLGIIAMILFGSNDPRHFGTLHFTILTLFQCSTLDNWIDVMFINMYGCDLAGYDDFPEDCTNPKAQFLVTSLYFIVFIILGALVLLTLFIGVVTTGMDEAALEQKEAIQIERKTRLVAQERNITPHLVECYKEVFEMIDLNGGNTIEIGELKLGMKAAGRNITDANLLTLWRKVDKDISGGIDFSEFLSFMLNLRQEGDSRRSVKGEQFNRGPMKQESFGSESAKSSPVKSEHSVEGSPSPLEVTEGISPLRADSPVTAISPEVNKPILTSKKSATVLTPARVSPSPSQSPSPSKLPSRPQSRQESIQGELDNDYRPVVRPKPARKTDQAVSSGKISQDSSETWLQTQYGRVDSKDEGDGILFVNDNKRMIVDNNAPVGKLFDSVPEVSPDKRFLRSSKSHWHNDAGEEIGCVVEEDPQSIYDQRSLIHQSLKLALQARHTSFEEEAGSPSKPSDYRRLAQSTRSGKGPGGRRVISKMVYI